MLTLKEKKDLLIKEFDQINTNHDNYISRDELFNYLDSKCKFQFDRNVADQLYERMDKDYDGKITLLEFINVYLEAEEVLRNKIENSRLGIQDFFKKKQEASLKLEESLRIERLNSFGIMEGSTLNLTIIQAQNLKRDDMNYNDINTYVICNCGDQKFQTNTSNSFNPVWNENFVLGINQGNENIQLMIMDYDPNSRDECLGLVNINLQGLRDQCKHDEWFELISNNGLRSHGKILVSIQWIYSNVAFYTEIIKSFDENLKVLHEDLISYETDLANLYEPFGNLIVLYKNHEALKQSQRSQQDKLSQSLLTFGKGSFPGDHDKITLICFTVYLLFEMMILWNRACFLDLLLASSFFIFIYFNLLNGENYAYIVTILLFSEIIDLSWLIIYTDGYWNGSIDLLADVPVVEDLNRFVVMISYFSFFLKIGIIGWLIHKRYVVWDKFVTIFTK